MSTSSMIFSWIRPVYLLTAFLPLLTACGGGGSGSDGNSVYTLTTSFSGPGSIQPSTQELKAGTTASFQLMADNGYHIGAVTGCNGKLTGSTYTVEVTENCTVTAKFRSQFTLKNQGFSGEINAIAPVKDGSGKVYLGGSFVSYNDVASNRIIRLNSDGTVDTAFDVGDGFNAPIENIATLGDGSGDIYVSGDYTAYQDITFSDSWMFHQDNLVKISSTGKLIKSVDLGFNGSVKINSISHRKDKTGFIYVGGEFYHKVDESLQEPGIGLVRIDKNGEVDKDFSSENGFKYLKVRDVSTDSQGRIFLIGDNGESDSYSSKYGKVYELNLNGTVKRDLSSNIDSYFKEEDYQLEKISVVDDGTGYIYVSGFLDRYSYPKDAFLIRIKEDGSVDQNFSIRIPNSYADKITTLLPANNGEDYIYLGWEGTSNIASGFYRISGDGIVEEKKFSKHGFNYGVNTAKFTSDYSDDVLVGGDFHAVDGQLSPYLVKIGRDGKILQSFSETLAFSNPVEKVVSLSSDGGIYAYLGASMGEYNGSSVSEVAYISSDSIIKNSKKLDERIRYVSDLFKDEVDNEVYFVGELEEGIDKIVKTSSNSYFDFELSDSAFDSYALNGGQSSKDGIYLYGYFSFSEGNYCSILKLKYSGEFAPDFYCYQDGFGNISDLVLSEKDHNSIYFSSNRLEYSNSYPKNYTAIVQKLDDKGRKIEEFDFGEFNGQIYSIVLDENQENIYVAGSFSRINKNHVYGLARVHSNGILDLSFGRGFEYDVWDGDRSGVFAVLAVKDGSGDLYAGGTFDSYNGMPSRGIIRLNRDGTVDTDFDTGTGFSNGFNDCNVSSIAPAGDGSEDIYVAGKFTSYNGTTVHNIVRLGPDGSIR